MLARQSQHMSAVTVTRLLTRVVAFVTVTEFPSLGPRRIHRED